MELKMENQAETEILNFEVEIYGDVINDGPKPIYDDSKTQLLGAFTIKRGDTIMASVPLRDNPFHLQFTSGAPFYFTPVEGPDGKIAHALISEVPIRPYSKKVEIPQR